MQFRLGGHNGDYAPLIDEVRKAGVLVYVSAFSDGFNATLKERADAAYELDGTTWVQRPGGA